MFISTVEVEGMKGWFILICKKLKLIIEYCRPEPPDIPFPSSDIFLNLTMELGITNITLAINDIIGQLITNLPAIINQSIVVDPNRFEDVKIRYENQTKKSRESNDQISFEYKKAWEKLINASNGGNCPTIGCLSGDKVSEMIDELGNTTEWVYILYVSFVLKEGSENETKTDAVVATMTNWIRENCFKNGVKSLFAA